MAFLDREQGASTTLANRGFNFSAAIKVSNFLNVLLKHNKVSPEVVADVQQFLSSTISLPAGAPSLSSTEHISNIKATTSVTRMSYAERANKTNRPLSKRILQLMELKKSNLCVACDVRTSAELLKLADLIGPEIVMLKTHIDIIDARL